MAEYYQAAHLTYVGQSSTKEPITIFIEDRLNMELPEYPSNRYGSPLGTTLLRMYLKRCSSLCLTRPVVASMERLDAQSSRYLPMATTTAEALVNW